MKNISILHGIADSEKEQQRIESKKKLDEHKAAISLLTPLVGLTLKQLTTKQREDYDLAIGQLLGVLGVDRKVKAV
jgi:hypothetical protein